ncbi:MAG: asparagine synthase (glutamine-hydrolyzing) [Kiritimatiellia bacterium]|jgi:asparagine synthase (glutamine-hydrolysing)|nr:asparagine synthase (glutamine-hydrolyzing) [Kiritimatiellia bacterium]
MCGITGIVSQNFDLTQGGPLSAMVESLRHRGPDAHGIDVFDHAGLGHTRLSIIDLESGNQPMRDATAKRSVVFNGEIYGYRAIRDSLNYAFRTTSDTEVLLALYDRYGTDMLDHLPGMFAFAIWDEEKQRLFAARDRFGEKPLYYAVTGDTLVFGSEIKAVLASGLVRSKLSRRALAHYLNRLYVPVGESIYTTIQQLPPAHALLFENGDLRLWRYWDLPEPRADVALSTAVEEFRSLLRESVEKQLVADVEVGAFLSGGLDSSTIVAVGAGLAPSLRTFSFGFTDGRNELPYASDVASKYGTEHVELHDDQACLPELAETMAGVYDEPFGDSSAIPTFMICRLAREHLKVVLTGDSGDELLGGYPWYRYVHFHDTLSARSDRANALHYFLLRAYRRMFGGGRELHRKLHTFNRFRKGQTPGDTHRRLRDFVSQDDLACAGLDLELSQYHDGSNAVDAAMRTDLTDYMTADILVKTDRAAMAHGLELRVPFLDVNLASFCISLPSRLKTDGRRDKILLREAFEDQWPTSLRQRGKQGFGAPVREWLARPEFRDLKQEYLGSSSQTVHSLLGSDFVDRVAPRDDDGTWALLMLAIWLNRKPVELS